MVRIKVCGITRLEDAKLAEELGAHALGFIFFKGSKRYISPENALNIIKELSPFIIKVGVFVNEDVSTINDIRTFCKLDRIQIYYDDKKLYEQFDKTSTIPVFKVKDKNDLEVSKTFDFLPLFDTYHQQLHGGTGKTFDWDLLKDYKKPYILAGGINCDNIIDALNLKPYAIDIASGLESKPGIKDAKKMFEFFKKIRENQLNTYDEKR